MEAMMDSLEKSKGQKMFEDAMLQKLIKQQTMFIFVATPYSMRNKDRVSHCAIAAKFSKTMYAVVKRGIISRIYWRKFKKFPWKTVYMFKTKEDLEYIVNELIRISEKEAKQLMKKTKKSEENIGYA